VTHIPHRVPQDPAERLMVGSIAVLMLLVTAAAAWPRESSQAVTELSPGEPIVAAAVSKVGHTGRTVVKAAGVPAAVRASTAVRPASPAVAGGSGSTSASKARADVPVIRESPGPFAAGQLGDTHDRNEHHGKAHHGKAHHGKAHHGKAHHGKAHHGKRHHGGKHGKKHRADA
jgi:hypothetical protein